MSPIRVSSIVAVLSFMAGASTFVALSNVAQFRGILVTSSAGGGSGTSSDTSKIPSVQAWLAEYPENVPRAADKAIKVSPPSAIAPTDNSDNDALAAWPFQSPAHVRVLFVHVGKAGGMSLNTKLKVMDQTRKFLGCRRKYQTEAQFLEDKCRQTPGAGGVSKLTLRLFGHIHRSFPEDKTMEKWLVDHSNLLLFTVRDPIDRLRSAFVSSIFACPWFFDVLPMP